MEHRVAAGHLNDNIVRAEDEKCKLLGDEDQQSRSKDSVHFFDEIQYQTVTPLPFGDPVAVHVTMGLEEGPHVIGDALEAGRSEAGHRQEQDDCETFA